MMRSSFKCRLLLLHDDDSSCCEAIRQGVYSSNDTTLAHMVLQLTIKLYLDKKVLKNVSDVKQTPEKQTSCPNHMCL